MISIQVSLSGEPLRIDAFLALHYPEYTRSFIKKLILQGNIHRNDQVITKASSLIHTGDIITVSSFTLPERTITQDDIPTQYQNFCKNHLIFEHEHFLIIDKPAGLITHPTESNSELLSVSDIITLERPEIAHIGQEGRHGIVHRLDRETSGLLIIARTEHGYQTFIELFKQRSIKKTYYAIVQGKPEKTGCIDASITRHPSDPRKMICGLCDGRQASTSYEVIEYFNQYALIKAHPLTGRTHQIRVHMTYHGNPVLGDSLYGTSSKLIKRQALHAHQLQFEFDKQQYEFTSPLPKDMQNIVQHGS